MLYKFISPLNDFVVPVHVHTYTHTHCMLIQPKDNVIPYHFFTRLPFSKPAQNITRNNLTMISSTYFKELTSIDIMFVSIRK